MDVLEQCVLIAKHKDNSAVEQGYARYFIIPLVVHTCPVCKKDHTMPESRPVILDKERLDDKVFVDKKLREEIKVFEAELRAKYSVDISFKVAESIPKGLEGHFFHYKLD